MEEKEDALRSTIRAIPDSRSFHKFFLFSRNSSKTSGFTLVEVLIVMGVIGALMAAVIIIINPVGQMQKARDSKMKSNMSQIQTALELYRSDCGSYPASVSSGAAISSPATCSGTAITYLQNTPTFSSIAAFNYTPQNSNTAYTMTACLERDDLQITQTGSCATSHRKIYQVTSP